jgi:hypothetical protein
MKTGIFLLLIVVLLGVGCAHQQTTATTDESSLSSAKARFAEGDFNATGDICDEILKRDSSNKEAKELSDKAQKQLNRLAKEAYTRGYILESMNRREEANQYYNRAKNYVRPGDAYYERVNRKVAIANEPSESVPSKAKKFNSPRDLVEKFLGLVAAGRINEALDFYFAQKKQRHEQSDYDFALSVGQYEKTESLGYDFLSEEKFGKALRRLLYLAKYKDFAIAWEFYIYKPESDYIISFVHFTKDYWQVLHPDGDMKPKQGFTMTSAPPSTSASAETH